ncbi:YciI family protein [Pseudomonas sp.]|uniref:YciI family protein n=1 Tax=Pseudomonas sp. TaxID=306 RepID=UPI00289F0CAE|nr:YciI family protein [Pseudomonas sp.]
MQFALIAYDYDDALERRLQCREEHVARLHALAASGNFLGGGALLNTEGKMIGSNVHVAFESRAALDIWLQSEPYLEQKVWEKVEVLEIKRLPIG